MAYGYSSGWCSQCGRRRGGDGRCANCDPWWTNGLIQVGAPLIAAGAAVLVIAIASLGGRTPEPPPSGPRMPTRPASAPFAPYVPPAGSVATILPSAPSAPFVANPAPTFAQPRAVDAQGWRAAPPTVPVSPDAQRWAELEQLRSLVWSASASERATRDAGSGPHDEYPSGGSLAVPES